MSHRYSLPLLVAIMLTLSVDASAFCGFYVAGADTKLYNDATMVVMMREGKRTVLSMQNNYQGPPEDFAMIVPVPVVLQKENVKTLPPEVFDRVDSLAAPRLVEYWEQDPCRQNDRFDRDSGGKGRSNSRLKMAKPATAARKKVVVEAQFVVGEYDIVILSAQDSGGLNDWLKENKYNIPDGAEPLLRPYVQEGMKFFVAKVDSTKLKMKDGRATLSPLRFHYEDEKFRLPVRLGLINAKDKQDLIVHILAKGKRFEASNFENVTIPTNITVSDQARESFGSFYGELFDQTLAKNPKAVVTEYSWDAGSCDPCPVPALRPAELSALGYDVIKDLPPTPASIPSTTKPTDRVPTLKKPSSMRPRRRGRRRNSMVLTRLHIRYDKNSLAEDIVFKAAEPIVGGREFLQDGKELERGSRKGSRNNFQARYAMRHRWEGKVECKTPRYNVWGGPPGGKASKVEAAKNTAFAKRGVKLASFVREEVKELGIKPEEPLRDRTKTASDTSAAPASSTAKGSGVNSGPAGCSAASRGTHGPNQPDTGSLAWAMMMGLALLARRRQR